jgi:hypothetical protein
VAGGAISTVVELLINLKPGDAERTEATNLCRMMLGEPYQGEPAILERS